jgi:hypothetical protein
VHRAGGGPGSGGHGRVAHLSRSNGLGPWLQRPLVVARYLLNGPRGIGCAGDAAASRHARLGGITRVRRRILSRNVVDLDAPFRRCRREGRVVGRTRFRVRPRGESPSPPQRSVAVGQQKLSAKSFQTLDTCDYMSHTVVYIIRYTVLDDGLRHVEPLGPSRRTHPSGQVGRQRLKGVEFMVQIPTGVEPNPPEPSRDPRWRCGGYLVAKAPKLKGEYVGPPAGRLQPPLSTSALRRDRRG